MRAVIYARISSDRSGEQQGVDRQVTDCQSLVTERGWTVDDVLIDNDVSAFSGRVRPQFERLLDGLREGRYEVVVAYHVDRLYRRLRDLIPLLEICEKTGASVATVKAGSLDLSTASGRTVASILGAVAEGESARQAERIRREKLDRALAGKPNGSLKSYGYEADGTVVESEAAVVRELAERVLAGDSLRSVTADLNDRGVPAARGGVWRQTTIRQLLMAARLSGQREHMPASKGRGYSNAPIVAQGTWQPILSVEQTARLRTLLSDPARRNMRPGRQLLTGVLRCGNCGHGMNSHADSKGGRRYVCIKLPGTGKCGKRSVVGPATDEFVVAVVTEAIYGGGSPRRFMEQPSTGVSAQALSEAERLNREIKTLARRFANDELTELQFEAQREELKRRRDAVVQPATHSDPAAALAALPDTAESFNQLFSTLSVDRQRAILSAVLESIQLGPVKKRGHPGFDVERFGFIWRG